MVGEYWRIQIYFRKKDERVFRAIKALAQKRGISVAHVARDAIRKYLDDEEVVGEVLEAASSVDAREYIRDRAPCGYRTFIGDRTLYCKAVRENVPVERCVECGDYEPK